jgi:inner membrane protein
MDNLTHTLTGLMISRAGFNRWCPHATTVLLLAANAPDIDVVTAVRGSLTYLEYHRHITHALVSIPVMAAVATAIAALIFRVRSRREQARMFIAACVGVLSHVLLDWTNMYGIRLKLPFSGEWLRLDIMSVIDVWVWAVLLLAVAAPAIARLVSLEIGARAGRGRGWAIFALAFILLYGSARYALHARAVSMLDSRVYSGSPPLRVAALPHPFNPLLWTGVVETAGFFSIHRIDLTDVFDPSNARLLHKPEPNAAIDRARASPVVQGFLRFSQLPYWRVTPSDVPEGGARVDIIDLRFGRPPSERFTAMALIDANGGIVKSEFSFGPRR